MPATVAVSPGGDRVLATSGDGAAYAAGADWHDAPSPGTPLREVALGSADGWAVTAGGALLHLGKDGWSGSSQTSAEQQEAERLAKALGWDGVDVGIPVLGWAGVSLDAHGDGFAVGAGGAIARLDTDSAKQEHSPVSSDLTSVAGAADRAVAAGGRVVLERNGDGWAERHDAEALVGDADFTATAAASDGTLLAAAGGTIVGRRPGTDSWVRAALAPLGTAVRRLAAWRDHDGMLHAVVLTDDGGAAAVLEGDANGWRAIVPAGLDAVSDIDFDAAAGTLAVGGTHDGAPVVETIDVMGGPA